MDNKNLGIFLLITTTMAQATRARQVMHSVGEKKGWTVGVDYKAWAASRKFGAYDRLYFGFDSKNHNLYKINAKQFEECSTADAIQSFPSSSGQMSLYIGTIGDHYYISGVGDDCNKGMKLHITAKEK
ncbi:mavicyanin-like [Bidens hawaiensis]|uniref:mavicyanin-like n=1 Tax=Bidens hawaiensis TaxID=980011 RepID=UPI00404AC397